MPTLEKFINEGCMGNISTLDPPLSPMLWTSIGTGKTAEKHGILGFVEPNPSNPEQNIRPVSVTSRKVKALWNILTHENYKTHLVGWWPSHPAEPINGISVSDMYHQVSTEDGAKVFEMAKGTVYPEELASVFEELRMHPTEITQSHILPFMPLAEKIDQAKDKSLQLFAVLLSQCVCNHNAATWILENKEWDFLGVYFNTIDHFCHGFMKYHPPLLPGIDPEEYEIFNGVVEGIYRYHDMMLERYLQLAGEDATVIIVSDHGFHSNHLRPKTLPNDPAAPAFEHSQYGIVAMKGPGIVKDERIYGASILDITPTVLALFGLPVGRDMDGKILVNAFSEKITPEFIDSWENVEGNFGMHPPDRLEDPWSSQQAMNQLVELGYVEAPGSDQKARIKGIEDESQYYLACTYLFKRDYAMALPILEKLFEENPTLFRYGLKLAGCYQSLGKIEQCRATVYKTREINAKGLPHLDFLEGSLLLSENKPRMALEKFAKAEEAISHYPNLYVQLGNTYVRLKRYEDALRAYSKALELDPEKAVAHHGLGVTFLRLERFEEAIDELLTTVGLLYFFPAAHYHLGEALLRSGEYEMAEKAFKVSVTQMPGNRRAHQWLIKLYRDHLNDPAKAEEHDNFIKNNILGTITVVSGLPRSGTSMMMQILAAGGIEPLTDEVRQEDDNNPKGYYEYEKVKRLHLDNSWMKEADNKVVKIVAPLLMNLPPQYNYKVVFMLRGMEEIIFSQQKMLGKPVESLKSSFPVALVGAFSKQLEKTDVWLKSQPNISYIYVNYSDVLANPKEQVEQINSFFDNELDEDKMLAAIDPKLYRNKSSELEKSE